LYGEIRLICNATGSTTAPDGVDWFFNGEPVTEIKSRWNGRLVELNQKPSPGRTLISELIVKKVTMIDGGHYVCRLTKTLAEGFKVHVLNGIHLCKIRISDSNNIWLTNNDLNNLFSPNYNFFYFIINTFIENKVAQN